MLLSGCFASNMVKLSPDTYMVRVEDHAGIFAFNRGKLNSSAIKKANDFAASEGKIAIPLAMESHPVGILGDWAAVEYQFRVVDKKDPEARRTHLIKSPDMVIKRDDFLKADIDINAKEDSGKSSDLYTELTKLDDLQKRGILTKAEFEIQKKR